MAKTKKNLILPDRTVWPNPLSEDIRDAAWRLVHCPEQATAEDRILVVGVVEAYCQLMTHPAWTLKEVGRIVSMIRKTMSKTENAEIHRATRELTKRYPNNAPAPKN